MTVDPEQIVAAAAHLAGRAAVKLPGSPPAVTWADPLWGYCWIPPLDLPGKVVPEAVAGWHDGDTPYCTLWLGGTTFIGHPTVPARARIAHINAPELTEGGDGKVAQGAGLDARDYAAGQFPDGRWHRFGWLGTLDNYGRPLIDLRTPSGVWLSTLMLGSGHATPMG